MEGQVTKKELSVEELKKRANKSLSPFIAMIIVGAVLALVILILVFVFIIIGISEIASANYSQNYWESFFGISTISFLTLTFFGVVADGLIGAGIPLLIVTKVRKNNAIKLLKEKENKKEL